MIRHLLHIFFLFTILLTSTSVQLRSDFNIQDIEDFALPAEEAPQPLTDNVTIKRWIDFKAKVAVGLPVKNCPQVNHRLYKKITASKYGHKDFLSNEEFIALVGGQYQYFGIFGGAQFYNNKNGRLEDTLSTYARIRGFDVGDPDIYRTPVKLQKFRQIMREFGPNSIPDDTPILCGDGSIEKQYKENQRQLYAEKETKKREYERTCEACTLKGGPLLQAIYDGDYNRQYQAALTYMSKITLAGGRDAAAYGTLFTALSNVGDITMLEDLIGSYMLYTSGKWGDQCYSNDSKRIEFTREFSDIVIETYNGIELERFKGGSTKTNYKINPEFSEACNKLCNKHGAILMTATAASGFGPKISAARVFYGLSEFVNKYQCRSPEIKRFETNLLNMWKQERAEPSGVRRNSASEHFKF